jgi:hypothetical protein
MADSRNQQRTPLQAPETPILAAETLRHAIPDTEPCLPPKGEERISAFWRICGGTLLSITALVALTVCQHFNSSLNELRSDLGRLNEDLRKDLSHLGTDLRKDLNRLGEAQGDLVKKDEYNIRMKSVWDSIKELRDDKAGLNALRERSGFTDQRLKVEEDERKELAREVQRLREVKAGDDSRKELLGELQRLRERVAAVEGRHTSDPGLKPAVHRPE